MLEWFTEDALFPACIGILLAIVFVGLAFSSGEMSMMKLGLGVGVLTAMLVATEIFIVTDREEVENSLYEMATSLRENDFEGVYEFLATDDLVRRAKGHLSDATCHGCNITAINGVEVDSESGSATADFVAFAKASDKRFTEPVPIQRRIKLQFQKIGQAWKVSDFETSDPRAGISL